MKAIVLMSLALPLIGGGLWLALPVERLIASDAFVVELAQQPRGDAVWALLVAQLAEDSGRTWEMERGLDIITLRSMEADGGSGRKIRFHIFERFDSPPSRYLAQGDAILSHRWGCFEEKAAELLTSELARAGHRLREFLELLAGHTPSAALPSPD